MNRTVLKNYKWKKRKATLDRILQGRITSGSLSVSKTVTLGKLMKHKSSKTDINILYILCHPLSLCEIVIMLYPSFGKINEPRMESKADNI